MTILHDKYNEELDDPKKVAPMLREWLATRDEFDREKEHLFAMHLGARYAIRAIEVVTMGIADATIAHPRELFRRAIALGSVYLVIAHNHTSGKCEPSPHDLKETARLVKAGKIIGIPLLDHIIFTDTDYYSFHHNNEK